MKRIIIKWIRIINFKGIRDLRIDFDATETDITGCNGSGKTTIADALTWLLFKKNSLFETEFDLKTLDADGKIIYKLPHEVSAGFDVDGEEIVLCRRLIEKWPKRNGVPTFTGNTIEQTVNDVPCNEKEYNAKIAEICDEDTFKKITSPTFFVSQKYEKQKSDLLRMAGEINDADLAAGNEEFEMLLGMLGTGTTKKSIDELKREIGAKKSKVKDEIDDIPGRIDEKKRDIARDTDDWAAIESEIETVTAARDDADARLTDINAAAKQIEDERYNLAAQISNRRIALKNRRQQITDDALAGVRAAKRELQRIDTDIDTEQRHIDRLNRLIKSDTAALNDLNARRSRMLNEYRSFDKRIAEIQAETITFDENDFVCPTCNRPLELNDIATKQSEMTERFESDKRSRIARLKDEKDANLKAGQRVKSEIEQTTANITAAESERAEHERRITELQTERKSKCEITEPDVEPIISVDPEIVRITAEIAELESKQNEPMPDSATNRDELKSSRDELNKQLDALKTRLSKRDNVADAEQRIAELESKYRVLNDELNELEHIEYIIAEFSKTKSKAIDERINGMFKIVRFRWIKYRINGDEKETCEATINGVPYASLNTAGRIIAGIDIINAICRFEGITAPVFIDNRESITTELPEMESQIVSLIATTDKHITVKQHKLLTD